MTWADTYLVCFLVGFVLSLFSLMVGVFHIDFPGKWDNFLHLTHGAPHLHGHMAGLHHGHLGQAGKLGQVSGKAGISPVNFSTIMAFLAWFGGAGYLLTSVYRVWFLLALGLALLAGLAGASLVFWFLVKVLLAHDRTLDPGDYDIVGVLGTITSPVRAGGTGEIVYVQGGSRKSGAVRSETGTSLAKGAEVVVTRFEKGVAYVRSWEELEYDDGFGELRRSE